MQDFRQLFGGVEDPRRSNATRHDLHDMPMTALTGTICGGEGCTDMALHGRTRAPLPRRFPRLEHGIPGHDAFPDLYDIIDPAGPVRVDGRSNRTTAPPALPAMPDLEGTMVTADAMHAQRQTAAQVTARGGDHALALKGNRGTLHDDVRLHVEDPHMIDSAAVSGDAVDKGHGRIEVRRARVRRDVGRLQDAHDWPGPAAVGAVEARRETRGRTTTETRHFPISQAPTPERLPNVVRSRWRMGNSPHWALDVTMNEDRQRTGNGPETLALLRRMALNPARATPEKRRTSMRARLKRAGWDDTFLPQLIRAAAAISQEDRTEKV